MKSSRNQSANVETKKRDGHDNFFASKPTNPEFGASYKGGWLSYTFHFTGETRPITYHITCNSKNLIYMIRC